MAFSTQDSDEVLSEINVTPLVDVMLVLLVVFIVTAPLLTNAIPINLPKTEAVAPVEQKDPLVVSIDGEGKLFINKDQIQPDLLETNLKAAKDKDADVRVQLQADDGVNYGEVARAMAAIERAGISKLGVITARRYPAHLFWHVLMGHISWQGLALFFACEGPVAGICFWLLINSFLFLYEYNSLPILVSKHANLLEASPCAMSRFVT